MKGPIVKNQHLPGLHLYQVQIRKNGKHMLGSGDGTCGEGDGRKFLKNRWLPLITAIAPLSKFCIYQRDPTGERRMPLLIVYKTPILMDRDNAGRIRLLYDITPYKWFCILKMNRHLGKCYLK